MVVYCDEIRLQTKGEVDIVDITENVQTIAKSSNITNGIICLFVPGSTAALTTLEYEPGLKQDLPHALNQIAPKNKTYAHHETWHDDNGHKELVDMTIII